MKTQPVLEDGYIEPSSETPDDTMSSEPIQQEGDVYYLQRAQEAFRSSDDWFDTALRRDMENNLRMFNSEHELGSKYYSSTFKMRSKLFRPKIRTQLRKLEAACAQAFFSTRDAVSVQAYNDMEHAGATLKGYLLNYHLENSVPWYQVCLGGLQDSAKQGVVISKQTWDYREARQSFDEVVDLMGSTEQTGRTIHEYVKVSDKPKIELLPVENIRLSPACNWTDPINSSPFLIELMPFYIIDLKELMARDDGDPGILPYRNLPDEILHTGLKQDYDSVRDARDRDREDRFESEEVSIRDYQTVWVHRNIIRIDGEDWIYDTLGDRILLSDPVPFNDVFPTKNRNYVMGTSMLESHRIYPTAPTQLLSGLQTEINELANLRIDNIRLSTNPRYFLRRNSVVDTDSLLRNTPGGITYVDDVGDVKEREIRDVTSGSFQETSGLSLEMDELTGSFGGQSVVNNRKLGETVGGMGMMAESSGQTTELSIRTFAETWAEPVLAQLLEFIQQYETDERIMGIAGQQADLNVAQAFRLLDTPVKPMVNVGFGATSPEQRIQRLLTGFEALGTYFPQIVAQADGAEVAKEIMGALGWKDGSRFFPALKDGPSQEVQQLQEQIQELTQILETEQMSHESNERMVQMRESSKQQLAEQSHKENRWKAMQDGQLKIRLEEMRLQVKTLDIQMAQEDNDSGNAIKREELRLQKLALNNSILQGEREMALRYAEASTDPGQSPSTSKPSGQSPETPAISPEGLDIMNTQLPANLPGNDMGGVVARDNYGTIPGEAEL